MIAVADTFSYMDIGGVHDAFVHDAFVIERLLAERGTRFDPDIVNVFVRSREVATA